MTAELPKLPETELRSIAESLFKANAEGCPIAPPSTERGMGAADAEAVRRMLRDLHEASGRKHAGYKVGFTSKAYPGGAGGSRAGIRLPVRRLPGPGSRDRQHKPLLRNLRRTGNRVWSGEGFGWPGLHRGCSQRDRVGLPGDRNRGLADRACRFEGSRTWSRTTCWRQEWCCRGTSSAPGDRALDSLPVRIETGTETCEGATSNVLGHPAASVAWLARRLSEGGGLDGALRAGHIVMSGSATKYAAIAPGERLRADFGDFGSIEFEIA